jgi:hypothetical protein
MKFKSNIKLNYLVIIFLLVFTASITYVFRYELGITGYIIYQQINYTQPQQIETWEPLGVKSQNVEYMNSIEDTSDGYFLNYFGEDIDISYKITPQYSTSAPLSLFSSIRVKTNYEGTAYDFQPSLGGPIVNLGGKVYKEYEGGSVIKRTILKKEFNNKGIYISYNYSTSTDYLILNVRYSIKGKVLVVNMSSPTQKIIGIGGSSTGGQSGSEEVSSAMTYATDAWQYALLKNKKIFFKFYPNLVKSSATFWYTYKPTKTSSGNYYPNMGVYYNKTSMGEYQPLQEVYYFIASPNIIDLYPKLPDTISQYKDFFKNRIVMDFWSDGSTASYSNYFNYTTLLYKYGFRDLYVDFLGRTYPQTTIIKEFSKLGYLTTSYTDYIIIKEGSAYDNLDFVATDINGNKVIGWTSGSTRYYLSKYAKRIDIAKDLSPQLRAMGQVGEFSDQIAAATPWDYVDMNINGPIEGMFKNNFQYMQGLTEYIRQTEAGPVITEGFNPIYWINILDSYEASTSCCNDAYLDPVIVDFDLMQIHPKLTPYGGYWRRFMPSANNNAKYKGIKEADIDKYTTTHVAFGHIGFIDSTAPWMHNVSDKLVIKYYYLMKELQKEYALEDAVDIRYYVTGQWLDVSDAMRAAYDFVNAQVRVTYDNGLVVYANRHDNANLNVDYEGKTYVIPPSGFFAYNPNDGFFEFSGLQNGKRVDISENGVYTYLDPRNNGEMNFTLHDNNYYLAQRFNIGTGLQNITYTFTIMDKTIITTSEPLRLTRLPMTGNMVKVTMNSATGSQTTTNLLETKSILVDSSKFGIKIDGSAYTSGAITGIKQVEIDKNNDPALKFNYDFSQGVLNLNALDIQEVSGYIIVKNLNINNKTIYLDRASNASRVCIEDADINTIADISSSCKGANEVLVACPGTNGRYSCNIVGNKYEVSGLTHSGAMEYGCSLHWNCSGWSGCYNDSQARTCGCGCYFDSECTGEYALQQSCTCSLPWSCNEWSSCVNEMQVRTCTCGCGIDSECTGDHSAQQACACSMPWNCSEWSSCSNGTQTRDCICDCEISSDCHGNNTIKQNCTMPPVTEQPSPPPSGGGGGGIIIPPIITNNTPVVNQTTNLSSNNTINPPVQNQTINYTQPPKNLTNTTKAAGKVTAPGQIRKKLSTFTARLVQNMAQIALDATTLTFIAALFIMTMAALIMHRKSRIMHPKYSQGTEQMRAYQQQLIHMRPREQHYQELAGYIQKSRDAGVEEQVIIKKLSGAGWKADVIKEYMKK